jgi:hypothetical protein
MILKIERNEVIAKGVLGLKMWDEGRYRIRMTFGPLSATFILTSAELQALISEGQQLLDADRLPPPRPDWPTLPAGGSDPVMYTYDKDGRLIRWESLQELIRTPDPTSDAAPSVAQDHYVNTELRKMLDHEALREFGLENFPLPDPEAPEEQEKTWRDRPPML